MNPPSPSALLRFLGYARPYLHLIVLATLCGVLKFLLPATLALSLQYITNHFSASTPGSTPNPVYRWTEGYLDAVAATLPAAWNAGTDWGKFNILAGTLAIAYTLWAVANYGRGYLAQLASHRLILDLRVDLYERITRMGHSFFKSQQSGGIVSRLMSDVALAQNFVGSAMTNIWMDLASCIFYLALLFAMDAPLTWAALAVFPLYIAAMRLFGRASKRTSTQVQEALEDFSGDLQERIAGIDVVKSFAAEQRELRTFFTSARRLLGLLMANSRVTNAASTVTQWITEMATLVIVWYGSYRLLQGRIEAGTVVAFILLVRQLYFPMNRISEMNTILQNSLAAIDRIFEMMDREPDVKEAPTARHPGRLTGGLRFEDVDFSYGGRFPTLHGIQLDIAPGESVALVGPSGAGKSSLIQLIPRFYDPTRGRILLDGTDLRDLKLKALRSQIGIVAQETLLFSGTIRDNLEYGRHEATDAEIEQAARAAYIHDFILSLPEGYDTVIGERGARLSGGQRQRLALARAFLKDPRILILDEATSALDSESEGLIQKALEDLLRHRTSLMIAHRLSTVLKADRIVVMDQGRIVDAGPHRDLLARCALYQRLYRAQFGDDPPAS